MEKHEGDIKSRSAGIASDRDTVWSGSACVAKWSPAHSFAFSQLIIRNTPLFSVDELEASLHLHCCVTSDWHNIAVWFAQILFLADRTNGRAIGTVSCPSVCRLWRYVLWLNGAS